MTLVEIFKEIGHFGADVGCNDKGGQHSYLETYDKLFKPFQKGCTMLEIGLAMGDSLKLWDMYFDNSVIVGVDISVVFDPSEYKNNVQIVQMDATKQVPPLRYDIVIDDGSHMENDQVKAFELIKGKMNSGGIYIIEDILSLDSNRKRFESLHSNCEIVDLRNVKGRFDDVLIIYRF